jgi:antitoxin (DNA-binding transcriptional repressor) of toxin-antitoxin stability system
MRAVTIKVAKARLNELVEAAVRGEQVVLMRGSSHVAAIVPISAEELELPARLTDPQARRLWELLAAERAAGGTAELGSPEAAVLHLAAPAAGRSRAPRKRPRRESRR